MRFFGECSANSDTFIQLKFDANSKIMFPTMIVASSSTSNFVVVKAFDSTDFYVSLLIFNVHFDPDASNCASKSFKTPPRVTSHSLRYFDSGPLSYL